MGKKMQREKERGEKLGDNKGKETEMMWREKQRWRTKWWEKID